MAYYAQNGSIYSGDLPPEGPHLLISEGEYQQAIAGMLDGKIVSIDGGFSVKEPVVWDVPEPVVIEPEVVEEPEAPIEYRLYVERTRRLEAGFDYNFDDARGVHRLNTTKADMEGWDEVTKLSTAALLSNKPTTTIALKTATGIVDVTAAEWQAILMVAGGVRQKIYQAYFALKEMDPIPSDFADDVYWS